MSTETLAADLKTCVESLATLEALGPLASLGDVVLHLKSSVYPMLENIVTEVVDMDVVIESLVSNAEDLLQPETAAMFTGVIVGAGMFVAELEKRMTPADGKLALAIKEWRALAHKAGQTIEEITVIPEDDDEEDGEDGEDDDDDDEGDEDDEGPRANQGASA